jgi:hypothetical protein
MAPSTHSTALKSKFVAFYILKSLDLIFIICYLLFVRVRNEQENLLDFVKQKGIKIKKSGKDFVCISKGGFYFLFSNDFF